VLDDGFAAIATAQRAARPEGTPVVVVEKLGGSGVGLVKSPNDALARQQRLIAGKTPVMGLFQERNSPDELGQGELGSADYQEIVMTVAGARHFGVGTRSCVFSSSESGRPS